MRRPALLLVAALGLLGAAEAETPPARPLTRHPGAQEHAKQLVERFPHKWELPGHDPVGDEFSNFFTKGDKNRPARSLRITNARPDAYHAPGGPPPTLLLGDMLYHAPRLLGGPATYLGVSCDSCHPNGGAAWAFRDPAESDRTGNIDLLFPTRDARADDGVYAPRQIPSIRGIRYLGPYMHDGSKASLADVVEGVVSGEFTTPLRRDWLGAVTLYVMQLDFVPNANVDSLGRLTAKASAAAKRGEAVFRAPREGFGGGSCATCHVPESFFTDHLSHRLFHGEGEYTVEGEGFATSTLLNIEESGPYFYDGSAKTLAEAVTKLDARHQLKLSTKERADLTAYLEAVGAVDWKPSQPSLATLFDEALVYLNLVLDGPFRDDPELWGVCLDTVRHQLRGAMRANGSPASVEGPLKAFEAFVARVKDQPATPEARAELTELRSRLYRAAGLSAPAVANRQPAGR